MNPIMGFDTQNPMRSPEEQEAADRSKTGRLRCIGCGKFLRNNARWNQCSDCDVRYPEEIGMFE